MPFLLKWMPNLMTQDPEFAQNHVRDLAKEVQFTRA